MPRIMYRTGRLKNLGYDWEPADAEHTTHPFLNAKRVGSFVFTSGQIPIKPGGEIVTGKVGSRDVIIREAMHAAELCAVQALYAAGSVVDLEAIVGVVKLTVYVNCAPGFNNTSQVANGASRVLTYIFEDAGKHTRTAVGVAELPLDAAVEIEVIFEVR